MIDLERHTTDGKVRNLSGRSRGLGVRRGVGMDDLDRRAGSVTVRRPVRAAHDGGGPRRYHGRPGCAGRVSGTRGERIVRGRHSPAIISHSVLSREHVL